MKTYFFIFLFFIFLLVGTLASLSLVNAACSLGASPLHLDANVKPGQTVEATWNFYNLYGDRITHVSVSKSSGLDWEIGYSPELHEAQYEVSGVTQTIKENLFLEKKDVVLEIPSNVSEGESYLKHPKQDGYIPAKQLKIYIKVPENAELWKDYKFVFSSVGNCFSEPGNVVPGASLQLEVNIKTTTEYYEKPVGEEQTISSDIGKKIINLFGQQSQIKPIYLLMTGITLILLIIFIILLVLIKRKKNKRVRRGK